MSNSLVSDRRSTEFVAPPFTATEDAKLGWLKEAVREGETFIRNTTSYQDFERAKNIIAGIHEAKIPAQLSRITVNMEKRLIREIVGTMSNLRPFWGFDTDNKDFDSQVNILNKLLLNWYLSTFADRWIKKWAQYAAVFGSGWIGPDWHSDFWTTGRGDIVLKVYSPEDVLPTQVPKDGDIQRAYAVTLHEEVPLNLARAMFPTKAHLIVPDRSAPSGLRKGLGKMASFLSPVLNRFAANTRTRKVTDSTFPVVDIYQTYILDLSINEGPDPLVMGEPGTYWNYTVPVLNSPIQDGVNPDGSPKFRRASVDDARIYPFRRLVTWCNSVELRDGPSYWWHGKVPAVKLSFDAWPWEFIGYSMTRDLHTIQDSNDSLKRAMDDSANARLRPTIQYDDRTLSKSLVESVDTRIPGQAVGVDFTVGDKPMRPLLDANYYDIPQIIPALVTGNEEMMKYLSGVNDFTAITKANQLPSSDTIEKIFEQMGAMVTDIFREVEASLGELGEMMKGMFFQFYDAGRRLQELGTDGLTPEDRDYFDPKNLVPDHMPHENPETPSSYTRVQRALKFMRGVFFKVTPNSMHKMTQMSTQLRYIQLQKIGVPLDPWTMAKVNDIPNFGRPPEGANTVFEKWVAFEKIKAELTGATQATVQEILAQSQMQIQVQAQQIQQLMAIQGAAGGGGGAPGGGGSPGGSPGAGDPTKQPGGPSPALGQNYPGRPPDLNGVPVIESKDGGTRSTITDKTKK